MRRGFFRGQSLGGDLCRGYRVRSFPSRTLRVATTSSPLVGERLRPRAWSCRPGLLAAFTESPGGDHGVVPPPRLGPRALFSGGAAQAARIFAPPLVRHPTPPLLPALSGTTKFRPTLVPLFLHFYILRLRG